MASSGTRAALGKLDFASRFGSDRSAGTQNQAAAFTTQLDQRRAQRYSHFMPKDKRETANSLPFDFEWRVVRGRREEISMALNPRWGRDGQKA
jgi:hypothetical protein